MTEPDDVLDAKLRAAFAPPPAHVHADAARTAIAAAAAAPVQPRRPFWPWFVAAAAAALLAAVFFATRPPRGPEGHDGRELGAMWTAAFEQAAHHGEQGRFCCDPSSDFGRACEQRFDARVVVAGGAELSLCGCYCGLPTGGCIATVARTTNGGLVGIFVVPTERDPRPRLLPDSGLQLARRELGPLVLYAVARQTPSESLAQFALAP